MINTFSASPTTIINTPDLSRLPWLTHGSTTRRFNAPQSNRVEDLRRMQAQICNHATTLVHADQRHTNNVALITQDIVESADSTGRLLIPHTDALVTNVPNVAIAILTADCAPIFLVDPITRNIALAHAGWKGTLSRIAEKTVAAMATVGSNPADIIVWIGPSAGGCCYEVDVDLVNTFAKEFGDLESCGFASGRMLDLLEINVHQLKISGLDATNIARSNYCTIHHREDFYSYRADAGTHGRIISMMALESDASR